MSARDLFREDLGTVPDVPERSGGTGNGWPDDAVPVPAPPVWGTGNTWDEEPFPVPDPPMSGTGNTEPSPLYADIAALLEGGIPDPPAPDVLTRDDGHALFYAGQVNYVFGDPESGKTWIALAAVAETLRSGGTALVVDIDHNGTGPTVSRLQMLGAPPAALADQSRFRYCAPEDRDHLLHVVADARAWRPEVTVLDSIGELLPMFGASSNSPDDFTAVHAAVMKPLAAQAGSCVISIDHLAKNTESRSQGATGTAAKRRTIGGVSLRVKVQDAFTPGQGGSCLLTIHKDRHGGLRAVSPIGDSEPIAGTFRMTTRDGATSWKVYSPRDGDRNPAEAAPAADVDALRALDPAPSSVRDVKDRMGWGSTRASLAWRTFQSAPPVFPVPGTQGGGTGNTQCDGCGESLPVSAIASGFSTHPACDPA